MELEEINNFVKRIVRTKAENILLNVLVEEICKDKKEVYIRLDGACVRESDSLLHSFTIESTDYNTE